MARQVYGTQTVIGAARLICRMVGRFGTARLTAQTSPEFGTAVSALVAACMALDALDDYVAVVDRTAGGTGVNDEDLPTGAGTIANEQEDAL